MFYYPNASIVQAIQFWESSLDSIIELFGGSEKFNKIARINYIDNDIDAIDIWYDDIECFSTARISDYFLKNVSTGEITTLTLAMFTKTYSYYAPQSLIKLPKQVKIVNFTDTQVIINGQIMNFTEHLDCVATDGCKATTTQIKKS